jgi:hypothetical protein
MLRRCLLSPSSGWSAWSLNARCRDNLKSNVSNVENPSCVFMFTHCIYCTVIQVNESTEYLDQQIKKTRLASKVTCPWYSLRSEFLLILKECPTRAVSRASARRQKLVGPVTDETGAVSSHHHWNHETNASDNSTFAVYTSSGFYRHRSVLLNCIKLFIY